MDDASMNNSSSKLVELLQESLHLAKTSCHFDSTHNYVGACDYYDKTIITIDDVMKMIPINSKEWIKLLNLRTKYDERLELLRYFMLTQSSTGTLLSPVILNSNDSNISGSNNNNNNGNSNYNHTVIHRRNAEFHEIDLSNYSIPDLPNQSILTPYWVLSNIKQIIEHGGFITTDIFCPHNIWYQQDLKFSGISTKTAAFEIIIKLITNQIETLYLSLDEDSLTLAEAAFINISEELFNLQNQLSKPFPYIKELKPSVGEPSSISQLSSLNSGDNTNNNSNTNTTSTGGNNNNSTNVIDDTVVSSDNANSITSNNDSTPTTTTTTNTNNNNITNNNNSQMKPNSSSRSLSQFMFAMTKIVRKYAEVG